MNTFRIAMMIGTAVTLAGCSKASMETEPVMVDTPMGVVTCQLYTPSLLLWDTVISLPPGLSYDSGVDICKDAGRKQRANG